MNEFSDRILVQRSLEGDIESFGQLCRQYYPVLQGVAYAIVQDYQLAEDVCQETLAAACERLRSLKNGDLFKPWLLSICRNTARDLCKDRNKRRRPIPTTACEQNHCDGQQQMLVRDAIRHLSRKFREIVVLRYYSRMTYAEIASAVGVTEQSVHGRLYRAKKKIYAYMVKHGFKRDCS